MRKPLLEEPGAEPFSLRHGVGLLLLLALGGGAWWYGWRPRRDASLTTSETTALEQQLARCGRVALVGAWPGARWRAEGPCELIRLEEFPAVDAALSGRDAAALVRALGNARLDGLVVAVNQGNPQLLRPWTLRRRLESFRPPPELPAKFLGHQGGYYTVAQPLSVSDGAGQRLVTVARQVLAGGPVPATDDLPGELTDERPGVLVAVALQGLRPNEVRSRSAHRARRSHFVVRSGRSLVEATREAAARIRAHWPGSALEEREGPMAEALTRLVVEVEVLYHWTAVAIAQGDGVSGLEYTRHLYRIFELGLHGAAAKLRGGGRYHYALPSAAVYRSRPDVDNMVQGLVRTIDVNGDGAADLRDGQLYSSAENLLVARYRTHHFREMSPEGAVERLDRGFVPTRQEVVTRENLRLMLDDLAQWLLRHQQESGLYEYKYFPARDIFYGELHHDPHDAFNLVRHGLAVYGLLMAARELRDRSLMESAVKGLYVLLDQTVIGPGWYESPRLFRLPSRYREVCDDENPCESPRRCLQGYCRLSFGVPRPAAEGDGGAPRQGVSEGPWPSPGGESLVLPPTAMFVRWKDVAKMGASAVAVMAIAELLALRPELFARYRSFLEGYATWFLSMQREDGSFHHYLAHPEDRRYYGKETTIYPGEILFALVHLYRLLGDEALQEAFLRGFAHYREWFQREVELRRDDGSYNEARFNDLVSFVPWMTIACAEMQSVRPRREYGTFAVESTDWLLRYQYTPEQTTDLSYLGGYYRVWSELPAMHGIVYTEATAAAVALARRSDQGAFERLRRATLWGCRFAYQQVMRPGRDDHYLPGDRARQRAAGGVRFNLHQANMRIDYAYHAMSALVRTLRVLNTDDWAPPPEA